VLTQTKEEFLMELKINAEISRTNSFTYSNISTLNGSQSLVDQQVSRLIKFVQCHRNSTVRKELEMLLPPIVCHLFFEMLKGKESKPAHDFLRKYANLVGSVQEVSQQRVNGSSDPTLIQHPIQFLPSQTQTSNNNNNSNTITNLQQNIYNRLMPSSSKHHNHHHQPPSLNQLNIDDQKLNMFRELISNLSCIRKLEDVKDNKLIFSFRSCKYKAKLANKTLSVLNNYLSKHGHVLLIQILHLWFKLDLYESSLDDHSTDDSSSSSSEQNHVVSLADNAFIRSNTSSSRHQKTDRFTDPSFCDTHSNDINNKYGTETNRCDDNSVELMSGGGSSSSSNMKLKRLRDCLYRVDKKYHKPIRIFNINYSDNSLCTASTDKQLCHLAAGFEDSNIVLWSINGYENYGYKPFQSFDDRLCQWSLNNCNRMLTDDISDYESSDDEIERKLLETCGEENEADNLQEEKYRISTRRRRNGNKYRRAMSIKEQWSDFTARNCSENNL
jgi:transcription initiation factor TFIID subunit 5